MRWPNNAWLVWLPGLVFVAALAVQGLVLWFENQSRIEQLDTEVEVSAHQAGLRMQTWVNDRLMIGTFLISRVENRYSEPAEYVEDARELLDALGGVQAVNWADAGGRITIVYPTIGNEAALGKNLSEHPSAAVRETLRQAIETRRPIRTPATVELLQGGRGFAAYFPAETGSGELLGFINVVFRVSDVVENCLDERFRENFRSAIVTEAGQEVYASVPGESASRWKRAQSVDVLLLGRSWTLIIAPTRLADGPFSGLTAPRAVASLGVAFLLALLTFSMLRQGERSRQSERDLVQFASSVHEVFWLASPDFSRIYYISPAYESLWGQDLDEKIYNEPNWWLDSVIPDDRERLESSYRKLLEGGFRENALPLHRIRRSDGSIRWIEARVYPIHNPAGELIRVAGVDEDVTARVEADRERETLMAAIEQTAESVAITDSGGVILYANRAYEKMHSVERSGCLGNVAKEITRADDESARAIWQAMEAGKPWTSQVESNVPGGALQIVEISISPVLDEFGTRTNLVIVGRDVSRELQLERQLLQSQRLESVGLLAGGVAHDFNNLLQALYGYVDLAQINLHDEQQTTSYLESMREAIERARQHVRKILLYARRAEHRHESWPVQDLVREVTDFLRPSTPSSIRFDIECDEDCPPALISPSDIHQVLVNLCTNAFHAMPSGGVLTIRVGTHEIVNRSPEWERLVPGRYVSLTVRDTGFGIADGDLVKIFDPYFTTKSQEEGTGLGLSVVHSIVVAHGGDIRVSSAKDQGTCFEILLPVGRRQSEQVDPATKDGPAPFYAAHVLLVDDEPSVLKVLKASLLTGGFTVDAFTDPLAALDQFRSSPETYDVVITDQTMPDMKGLELAERLQMERPGIPVILCSGLEPDPESSSAFVSRRMTKPVRPREVIDAVRQLLQQLERV